MNKCSFSFAGIVLAASEIFVLELQGNNTASGVQGSFINPPSQPLYAEPLYEYSGGGFYNGWRIGFITYMLACQNGTACNDGEPCTTSDVCTNNVCAGAPVMCKAMDACHDAGTCDPQRACAGGAPKVCPPGGACSMPGTCNPGTGVCVYLPAPNGTACDDANACTMTDTMHS